MEDLEYIKRFGKITIKGACDKLKINRGNLLNGNSTKANEQKVRAEIENQIARLYIKEE